MMLIRVNSVIRIDLISQDSFITEDNSRIRVRVRGTIEFITLSSSYSFGLGQLENLWPTSPQLMHALA
jgi:hypothetical protein